MQLRNMMLAAIFAAFMIISSYIVLPIGPVPHTLQPLVVLLSSNVMGWSFLFMPVLLGSVVIVLFALIINNLFKCPSDSQIR